MINKTTINKKINCITKVKECTTWDILHSLFSGSLKYIKNEIIMEVEAYEYGLDA